MKEGGGRGSVINNCLILQIPFVNSAVCMLTCPVEFRPSSRFNGMQEFALKRLKRENKVWGDMNFTVHRCAAGRGSSVSLCSHACICLRERSLSVRGCGSVCMHVVLCVCVMYI